MTRVLRVKTNLNLRSGPGTNYQSYELLAPGDLLVPYDWIQVLLEDGECGWVSFKPQYVDVVDEEIVVLEPQPIPVVGEPPWMKVARSYMGLSEVAGTAANPTILKFFMYTSFKPTKGDEDPWCSAALCAFMEEAGYKSTRNAAAISWENWGKEVEPRVGAVLVFPHHVALYMEEGKMLGGNQGNKVGISSYNPAEVVACRWPA